MPWQHTPIPMPNSDPRTVTRTIANIDIGVQGVRDECGCRWEFGTRTGFPEKYFSVLGCRDHRLIAPRASSKLQELPPDDATMGQNFEKIFDEILLTNPESRPFLAP